MIEKYYIHPPYSVILKEGDAPVDVVTLIKNADHQQNEPLSYQAVIRSQGIASNYGMIHISEQKHNDVLHETQTSPHYQVTRTVEPLL